MKRLKILPFIFALFMCFCLAFASCAASDTPPGGGGNGGNGGSGNTTSSGDVLIVYFSATGNTGKIAGYIADITGGTQFELIPQTPYTTDDLGYNDNDSRVCKEYRDESLRDIPLVKSTPDNWGDYETVFIGYPIWWGIAAWPVNCFITANDFTGKTIVPFCT